MQSQNNFNELFDILLVHKIIFCKYIWYLQNTCNKKYIRLFKNLNNQDLFKILSHKSTENNF